MKNIHTFGSVFENDGDKTTFTLEEFNKFFDKNYSHITHNVSDNNVQKYIDKNKGTKLEVVADRFSDYVLSQGLTDDVQESETRNIHTFDSFLNEAYYVKKEGEPTDLSQPAKNPRTKGPYIVKVTRDRGQGRTSTRYVIGSVEDLVGYFGYTLEIGNSHKRSINKNPKTIKQFMKALQDSYSEKEAAIYNRTGIDLVDAVPEGTPESEISDQTKNQ